jgi:hypothetical protein
MMVVLMKACPATPTVGNAGKTSASSERGGKRMAKPYNTGSREIAIQLMAQCAIRDQEALIDAMTPPSYIEIDEYTAEQIRDAREWIADFVRIAKQERARENRKCS